jgi:hypothetical protein
MVLRLVNTPTRVFSAVVVSSLTFGDVAGLSLKGRILPWGKQRGVGQAREVPDEEQAREVFGREISPAELQSETATATTRVIPDRQSAVASDISPDAAEEEDSRVAEEEEEDCTIPVQFPFVWRRQHVLKPGDRDVQIQTEAQLFAEEEGTVKMLREIQQGKLDPDDDTPDAGELQELEEFENSLRDEIKQLREFIRCCRISSSCGAAEEEAEWGAAGEEEEVSSDASVDGNSFPHGIFIGAGWHRDLNDGGLRKQYVDLDLSALLVNRNLGKEKKIVDRVWYGDKKIRKSWPPSSTFS